MFNESRSLGKSVALIVFFLNCLILTPGIAHAATLGNPFPVAATTGQELALGCAFDGTNYLVGIQGDATQGNKITAQLVSQSGTLVGSRISVGRAGSAPLVAFDGTNYLMVWSDYATSPNNQLYGVFIRKDGSVINPPFVIEEGPLSKNEIGGITFGGGKYLVVYHKIAEGVREAVYGRLISPSGEFGYWFVIPSGYGNQGLNNVAFDGTNFFVVWNNNTINNEVRGRFVSPSGTRGTEIAVKTGGLFNNNPLTVAFDGTNYLIVWTEEVDANLHNWDVFGQLVTPAGALSGGKISISTAPGQQFLPLIAFDGTNYVISWTDMRNDANGNWACDDGEGTCLDIRGQFISKSGALVGSEFTINNDAGNQLGGFSGQAVNEQLLGMINTGVAISGTGLAGGDVYSLFMSVPSVNVPDYFPFTLADEILTLQVISQVSPSATINEQVDVNGDHKIGLEDAIFILQALAGLRTTSGKTALHVTKVGNGQGTVTSLPAGIDCGSTCTAQYDSGTPLTLTATASSGSIFAGWSGACTGMGTCQVTMSENKSVTATFNNDTGATCTYSVSPTSQSLGPSGGSGVVMVAAGTGCTWTAASNSSWITITSGSSGTGNGTVSYAVAANSGPERSGTITAAGRTVTVHQENSIDPINISYDMNGGSGSFIVTVGSGFAWTAISNSDWITITSGSSGTGNGTVSYNVAANTAADRTGTITAAGKIFTVTQSANRPLVEINPTAITIMLPKNVPQTFTVRNIGPQGSNMGYRVADDGALGGFLDVQNATGTLAGGTSATITVSVKPDFAYTGFGSLAPATLVLNVYTPTAANYTKIPVRVDVKESYSISGAITTANGTGQPGVTVSLTGTPYFASTTTDADGYYTFTGLANGNYTVSPGALEGYSLSPASIEATVNGKDLTDQNFTATPNLISITLTPDNPTIAVGEIIQLTATGTYADGSTLNITTELLDENIWVHDGYLLKSYDGASIKVMGLSMTPEGYDAAITVSIHGMGSVTGSTNITVTRNQNISGTYAGQPMNDDISHSENNKFYGRRITGSFSSLAVMVPYLYYRWGIDTYETGPTGHGVEYQFSEMNFTDGYTTWTHSGDFVATVYSDMEGQIIAWHFAGWLGSDNVMSFTAAKSQGVSTGENSQFNDGIWETTYPNYPDISYSLHWSAWTHDPGIITGTLPAIPTWFPIKLSFY